MPPGCAVRIVLRIADPQTKHQHGQLPGDCGGCPLLRILAAARGDLFAMSTQIAVRPEWTQDVVRRTHQQTPAERIARFRNAQLRLETAALIQTRHQPEKCPDMRILENRFGSSISSTNASAVRVPTPLICCSRTASGYSLSIDCSILSSYSWILALKSLMTDSRRKRWPQLLRNLPHRSFRKGLGRARADHFVTIRLDLPRQHGECVPTSITTRQRSRPAK